MSKNVFSLLMKTYENKLVDKKQINELLKEMHFGNTDAANRLYELMKIPLSSHIYKQTKNKNAVEDILQDVFVILLKKVKTNFIFFNGFGYIFKITQREIYHYFKKLNKMQNFSDDELKNIPNKKDLEEELEFKLIFNSLNDDEKDYISLKAHGYQLEEIAIKKDVSISTVKRKLNDIILKLKRSYNEKKYD